MDKTSLDRMLDWLHGLSALEQLAVVAAHGLVVFLISFLFLKAFNSLSRGQVVAWTPVGPFFAAVCMIFALFLAFHAASIWQSKRDAERAFIQAGNAIRAFEEMVSPGQLDDRGARGDLRRYVTAVTQAEWGDQRNDKASDRSEARFIELQGSVIRLASQHPGATGARLYALLHDVARTRSDRLWIGRSHTEVISWLGVLLLGFAAHLSVAAVHFDRPRAGAVALALFATATTIAYWSLGVVDDPYRDFGSLSPASWLSPSN